MFGISITEKFRQYIVMPLQHDNIYQIILIDTPLHIATSPAKARYGAYYVGLNQVYYLW